MVELGINVPQDFLNEEIRCDYTVSSQTKEIWAVELDLLHQLDTVCKANNLTYFAGAGTLLGAIRHKGFIPWDDDIDIYMLRPDYDRLTKLAKDFKDPYFLQTASTDQKVVRKFMKLRNTHTTFATRWEVDHGVKQGMGIFIDIFPLDGISEKQLLNRIQRKICHYYVMLFAPPEKYNPRWDLRTKVFISIRRAAFHATRLFRLQIFRRYEAHLKKYSVEGTKMWGNRTIVFDCPKSRRPIEDWLDIMEVPFEFTTIPIPRNYDEILRQQYGNYMDFPADKGAGKLHQVLTISTDFSIEDIPGGNKC